ncbi:AMP-binding protein [uncultured Paraglaciecola sp.]|uniref:AMP-binding protein n=1 Tax=uncultured Paraglaciecola sp. TaxID=1765024 RepID=UPI0026385D6B|nr:AMP-binding protein [uncultured Paraglaciecola sp.]
MFFQDLARFSSEIALIEGQQILSYAQLQARVEEFSAQLPTFPALVILKGGNDIASLVAYLACLKLGHPILLADKQISDEHLNRLKSLYQPNLLIEAGHIQQLNTHQHAVDDRLALLLSTSGSTGSPKQVCLSKANLQANADSICQYLPIKASDKTMTTLSPAYSYGLSVINSHLLCGATIVLNDHSLISRGFWDSFEQHQINSFAGVPYSYEMLLRLRFNQKNLPSLRYFTQAGGKLASEKVQLLSDFAEHNGSQFFVMYGQTEATARMAYNGNVASKPEAIGRPIAGGNFQLLDTQGKLISQAKQRGELVYSGPNVMLGYANHIDDLVSFSPSSELNTGDLAYRDNQGDYFICGRKNRMIKPFGQRINLDEVEALLADKELEAAAVGSDNKLQIAIVAPKTVPLALDKLQQQLSRELSLHFSCIDLRQIHKIDLTTNNKRDYAKLQAWFHQPE